MATFTTAVTPVASATTAVNPNAGAYQSYTAGEYSAPKPRAEFSSALFDQVYTPAKNAAGQSQYDIARSGQEAAAQRNAQLRQEALSRQMAGMGLSNSGIALKQQQISNVQGAQTLQSGLAGINVAELSAAEAAKNAAQQRQFGAETIGVQNAQQTAERLGSQAFTAGQQTEQLSTTKELTYADLNLREKQVANQASQFNTEMDFKKWAVESGYTEAEAARAWQANENTKAQTATKEVAAMNITSSEKIANASIVSNEKINASKVELERAGIDIEKAKVYGYTDPVTGERVKGSVQIAADTFGLQAQTLEEQQKELWGWTDDKGVVHAGKYDLLSNEDKRAADSLYGTTINGVKVRGSLENETLIADLKARETQTGIDSFYGYTDPATGAFIEGSGSIAAKAFGLQEKTYELQREELWGKVDPVTGKIIPGKMQLMSNEDQRAAQALYGYTDPITGLKVSGTLELQNKASDIAAQGLTLQEARLKGWDETLPNGTKVHHAGESELAQAEIDSKEKILRLKDQLDRGMLDYQVVLDTDKAVQTAKANRYFTMGKNGEALDAQEVAYISVNDPLAYQSYLMGKEGKTAADIATMVEQTNQYRAASIANLDDPQMQQEITRMFASWGVEEAKNQQGIDQAAAEAGNANSIYSAKDFTTYEVGKAVKLTSPTLATNGANIPAGTYTVSKESGITRRGAWDGMKQDWLEEKGDVTYLVDSAGNKTEVAFESTSTEKKGDWWENAANPLSASFWEHPFGIGK